ncbi:MAG: 16S rRNA (adenine(1518)-N(6)/adenine(1519)-N(6))-dimethyltransferase RsmA, partial [bacterium]
MIRPKKSLGQNFLRDDNIARNIVGSLHLQPEDVVLEIGPGEGALTKHLVPALSRLIVVEVDDRVIRRMEELYTADELQILHQDFLKTDLAAISSKRETDAIRIIGNIPYNITSPILFHILDNRSYVTDATLMMQREVARRLIAKPNTKDYGILAVFTQLFSDVEILFDVSPSCFYPPPKVTSSLVRINILPSPRFTMSDEHFFRRMVRSVFGKRRKTLRNSLSYFIDEIPSLPAEFDLGRRPEDLTIQE